MSFISQVIICLLMFTTKRVRYENGLTAGAGGQEWQLVDIRDSWMTTEAAGLQQQQLAIGETAGDVANRKLLPFST